MMLIDKKLLGLGAAIVVVGGLVVLLVGSEVEREQAELTSLDEKEFSSHPEVFVHVHKKENGHTSGNHIQDNTLSERINNLVELHGIDPGLIDDDYLRMIEAFEAGDEKEVDRMMMELLEKDIFQALRTMEKLESHNLEYNIELPYQVVAEHLQQYYTGPERMELLSSMDTSGSIQETGRYVFNDWAEENRGELLAWVRDNPSFNNSTLLYHFYKQEMAGDSAYEVVDYIKNLPEDDARRNQMLTNALSHWAVVKPEDIPQFYHTLEPGDARADNALEVYAVEYASKNDGFVAMEWANKVVDESRRTNAVISVGATFMLNDKEGFEDWLESADLGDLEQREQLLNEMSRRSDHLRQNTPTRPEDFEWQDGGS
ncbi:hypothetical protein [Echinimonas agarilytica]|uniref:Uncharacterized protein n=1 Tax=Echinimonas agarilytica TaxID=1215918 RepID=A0AA41W6Q5_9GAMM|nr:hypothetical protein [Echinimonas agarilytica]MCM2679641.1 hypothetical protein [Echinimonas agarilytica]